MKISEAKYRAIVKYKAAKYKRIPLDVPIDFYDQVKTAAAAAGESVNGYIKQAITERAERDRIRNRNQEPEAAPPDPLDP